MRQIVFLTDGEIGNEQQLFDTIAPCAGARGCSWSASARPQQLSDDTSGGDSDAAASRISARSTRSRSAWRHCSRSWKVPAVTNLTATFSAAGAMDVTPGGAARPLSRRAGGDRRTAARSDGTLEIKGMIGDRPWIVRLAVAEAARRRRPLEVVGTAQDHRRRDGSPLGQASDTETDRSVLALALDHHLVSRLTSLVAVDATPSRPAGARLSRAELPLNLPAGWEFEKVFGERTPAADRKPLDQAPDRSAPGPLERRADATHTLAAALASAAPAVVPAVASGGVALPQTGTLSELQRMIGIVLLMLSLLLVIRRYPPQPTAH